MDWTDDSNALGRPVMLVESQLYELTLVGIRPKDVPKIRELVAKTYAKPAIDNLIEPLLKTVEALDRAALLALASLGDQDAILELGHFGKMTEAEAIVELKKLRNPAKPSLWKRTAPYPFVCSICMKKKEMVAKKVVLEVQSSICQECLDAT